MWSAYKAYMQGIIIKLNAFVKPQRTRQIDEVLASIKQKRDPKQIVPLPSLASALLEDMHKLRSLLTITL